MTQQPVRAANHRHARAHRGPARGLAHLLAGAVLLAAVGAGPAARAEPGYFSSRPDSAAAGQVPMGRTDPTATSRSTRGSWPSAGTRQAPSPRYQSPGGYFDGNVAPAQYSP
ncbi:MAG TPA: hypothetical protein VN699_12330, partial [Pirellulales bacterium]|nr:hypothetical protein [Pirellulales bacterium]